MRKVIEYYDKQTDEEAVAEYEAACDDENVTWFAVPNELADEVRKLLTSHQIL